MGQKVSGFLTAELRARLGEAVRFGTLGSGHPVFGWIQFLLGCALLRGGEIHQSLLLFRACSSVS